MGKVTFLVGGARSGKSSYAVKLAKEHGRRVAFIATCRCNRDGEMKKRIVLHKNNRPNHWKTFEETDNLPLILRRGAIKFDVVIIDCLTLLISDFISRGLTQNTIEKKIHRILEIIKTAKTRAIIVSNEVGLGIVPENKMARNFRDVAGRINQIVANKSDSVFFMVSGIPWRIK